MSQLFEKSIRTLELPRVLQLLADQAVSEDAKRRARTLAPETEPEEVLRLQDQTEAARTLIGLRGSPSFSGVKPVSEALDRADRGGSLNTRELLTIADLNNTLTSLASAITQECFPELPDIKKKR